MPDSCYPLPLTILEEKFKASKGFKWNSGKSQRLGGWGGRGLILMQQRLGFCFGCVGWFVVQKFLQGKDHEGPEHMEGH